MGCPGGSGGAAHSMVVEALSSEVSPSVVVYLRVTESGRPSEAPQGIWATEASERITVGIPLCEKGSAGGGLTSSLEVTV